MSLDLVTDGSLSNGFATIQDTPVASTSDRVAPNQVSSGVTRGSQVTINSTGIPQVLSGNQQTFGAGFYVSKPTIDVTTNKDPANFIFNSNQNVFKIALSGTATIAQQVLPLSTLRLDKITIPHGLSTIPIVQLFGLFPVTYGTLIGGTGSFNLINAYLPLPYNADNYQAKDTNVSIYLVYGAVDATNIYIQYMYSTNSSGSYTFPAISVRYYALQETAT